MSSLSIIDKAQNYSHLHHFVVQTRSFQIEKARDVDMYENLRVYINRQNEKRKQEMEMSEELKRARREKELKHKRDKSTLGDIKEEITKSNIKLNELKNEKHRLFTEFKRVLTVDSNRRNQIQKEEAANYQNLTFGPVTTTPVGNKSFASQPMANQSNSIMPNSAHSSILPSSLHHLQPIQSMFFSQPPPQSSISNPSTSIAPPSIFTPSSAPSVINQSRSNGRMPTSSAFLGSSSTKSNSSSSLERSKVPSNSSSASVPSTFASDRHRVSSFKRTHEQASNALGPGGVINIQPSASPSHLHYLNNYKQQMGQPSMSLPPTGFPQIPGQHIMSNLEMNHPLYQSFLYNNHYLNNSGSK